MPACRIIAKVGGASSSPGEQDAPPTLSEFRTSKLLLSNIKAEVQNSVACLLGHRRPQWLK
jgi:hypothetical protein